MENFNASICVADQLNVMLRVDDIDYGYTMYYKLSFKSKEYNEVLVSINNHKYRFYSNGIYVSDLNNCKKFPNSTGKICRFYSLDDDLGRYGGIFYLKIQK